MVYSVRDGYLPHLEFTRHKSSCRLRLVICLCRTSLFSTLWTRIGVGRMASVNRCTAWEYRNHQQFPRGFCRMAFPWKCLKWSKTRGTRDVKASKGSGRLQSLAATGMQQGVCWGTKVLPMGTEKVGRCLRAIAVPGLNFPSSDSSNNSVTEASHIHLRQVCVPNMTYFLWLSWLSIPCQFSSARFAFPFPPEHPGSASGADIAHSYDWLRVGESPSVLCVC